VGAQDPWVPEREWVEAPVPGRVIAVPRGRWEESRAAVAEAWAVRVREAPDAAVQVW
jgi:hypothetical protein